MNEDRLIVLLAVVFSILIGAIAVDGYWKHQERMAPCQERRK